MFYRRRPQTQLEDSEMVSYPRAELATVCIGSLKLEGLMIENGTFGIAVPQICSLFQFDKNQASRAIKSIMGASFQFDKWNTTLNPKAVNVLLLSNFELVLFELAIKQNPIAIDLSRTLMGLSLQQLFSDAFHVKFETEERQAWIFNRDRSKTTFKKYLTDSLKAYGYTENWQYGKFIHEMQAGLGIEDGTRDDLDNETLVKLTTTQESIGLAIEMGLEPYEAMRRCINRMN